ncbi:MAG: helix-turn-helix domain-containing protein [Rhodocyclales bacterium]|nr:helix-turn-helix domain-containing protein [Rhodocyclales bacterium]
MTEARALEGLDTEPAALDAVEPAESLEANTPGSVLRQAREARGQSVADVVQVIRFSARQIEALERDDYASLPGSTAVRGLVRNYAKFLRLDAAPLLAQLDPAVPVSEADVRPPTNMGEAEHPNFVEQIPPKLIAVGVLLVMLALTAYWYLTLPGNEGVTLRLLGTDSAVGVAPPSLPAAPAPAPAPVVAPATVPENPPESSAAVSGAPSSGGLRVEFDDRSWIEIRDATQKIVYVGEYPAGTRQNVDGKAPFQVWIGKASGVRLYLGERSIDLKPHTREEVARFSLE